MDATTVLFVENWTSLQNFFPVFEHAVSSPSSPWFLPFRQHVALLPNCFPHDLELEIRTVLVRRCCDWRPCLFQQARSWSTAPRFGCWIDVSFKGFFPHDKGSLHNLLVEFACDEEVWEQWRKHLDLRLKDHPRSLLPHDRPCVPLKMCWAQNLCEVVNGPIDQASARTWICSVSANQNTMEVWNSGRKVEMMKIRTAALAQRFFSQRRMAQWLSPLWRQLLNQCLSTSHTNEMLKACALEIHVCFGVRVRCAYLVYTPPDLIVRGQRKGQRTKKKPSQPVWSFLGYSCIDHSCRTKEMPDFGKELIHDFAIWFRS